MDRRVALAVAAIFLLAFTARAVPVKTGYHYWDETVYLQHGEIIAGERANNYDEFGFRPPLMGVMLGLLFLAVDSIIAAHVLVALLAASTVPLAFLFGRRLFGTGAGLLAAVGVAVSLEHIRIAHDILVDSALPVLWLGALLLLLRTWDADDLRWAAATGVVAGLAVLMKFTSLVLFPAVLLLHLAHRFFGGADPNDLLWDRPGWAIVGGFGATVAPYLAWSWVTYGSPLHVFLRAMALSGATDPYLTYVHGFPAVVALPFLLGLLLFPLAAREHGEAALAVAVPALALLVPLQFWLGNKELRFLLPVMPLLVVAGAAGLDRMRGLHDYAAPVAVALLLVPAAGAAWDSHDVWQARSGTLTTHEVTPTMEAADWLQANTPEDTTVYANYKWPPLAYYSERPVVLLPTTGSFQDRIAEELSGPGYVYVHVDAGREPTLDFLRGDPRFDRAASFDGTVHLFRYGGEG